MGYGLFTYFLPDAAIPNHGYLPGWPRFKRVLNDGRTGEILKLILVPKGAPGAGTIYAIGRTVGATSGIWKKAAGAAATAPFQFVLSNINEQNLVAGGILANGNLIVAGNGATFGGNTTHTWISGDGGVTFNPPGNLAAVELADGVANRNKSGVAVKGNTIVLAYGGAIRIARSVDAGATWVTRIPPIGNGYVDGPPLSYGFNGRLFMHPGFTVAVRISDDDGETWTETLQNGPGSLRSIAHNAEKGTIVVGRGPVQITSDNGASWKQLIEPPGAANPFASGIVAFPNGRFLTIGNVGNGDDLIPPGFNDGGTTAFGDALLRVPYPIQISANAGGDNGACLLYDRGVLYAAGLNNVDLTSDISVSLDFG